MSRRQNKYATFQRFAEPSDNFAGTGEWIDVCDPVLVQIAPLSGRELIIAQQVEARTTHKVKMHYRGDVWPKMRLRMQKPGVQETDTENDAKYRTFNIESVVNVNEANRELELMVVEVSSPPEYVEPDEEDG